MRAQRPTPLVEELLEPAATPYIAAGGGACLLGRVNSAATATDPEKPPQKQQRAGGGAPPALAKQAEATTAAGAPWPGTPGDQRRLTPLSTPQCSGNMYCFTPLATPSPSARCRLLEQFRWGFNGAGGETKEDPEPAAPQLPTMRMDIPSYCGGAGGGREDGPMLTPRWRQEAHPAPPVVLSTGPIVSTPQPQAVAPAAMEELADDDCDGSEDEDSDFEQSLPPARMPANVPRPPPGALHPSVGSARHALGACRRCCFFPRGRCINGYDCEFCHYEHEKRKRKSKRKGKKAVEVPPLTRTRPQVAASSASPGTVLSASQLLGTHLMAATAAAAALPQPVAHQHGACGMGSQLVYAGYPGQFTVVQMLPTTGNCFVQNGLNMMQPSQMVMAMPPAGMQQGMQQVISLEPAMASQPARPGFMQQMCQWY